MPDVFLASRSDLAWLREQQLTQPVDDAARRARRRLRRRLLPRRPAGVQRRQPAAVHALRRLADGHLLQHATWSTSTGWRPRARRARTPRGTGALELRPVRDRRRRSPAGRASDTGASTSTRRCAAWRRSSTPAAARSSTTTSTPPRWRSPTTTRRRALERDAGAAARPAAHADRGAARAGARPLEWFERGQARHDRGLPRRWCPSCGRCRASSFDVMPMPSLDSYATVGDITGLCMSPRAAEHARQAADFLVYATSHRRRSRGSPGRATSRRPTSRSRSPTTSSSRAGCPRTRGLQHRGAHDGDPAAARRLARARGGRRARPRELLHGAGARRLEAITRADRRGVARRCSAPETDEPSPRR